MVLAELGGSISKALNRINAAPVIDEKVLKEIVQEICKALLEADVNVRVVMKLRAAVQSRLAAEDATAAGTNK